MGFNNFFYKRLLEVEQAGVTRNGGVRPLSTRGVWGHAPKNLKFRSSEMQFLAFWASKRVFFMIILIDQ